MTTFHFNVAMNVRAYGDVYVEADTLDDATAMLTTAFVQEHFQPSREPLNHVCDTPEAYVLTAEWIDDAGLPHDRWIEIEL